MMITTSLWTFAGCVKRIIGSGTPTTHRKTRCGVRGKLASLLRRRTCCARLDTTLSQELPVTDLTPATTVLLSYNDRFAYADFSAIRMWLAEGCDMDRDIVPAMKACIAKKQDIKTVGYFTQAVYR